MNFSSIVAKLKAFAKREGKGIVMAGAVIVAVFWVVRKAAAAVDAKYPGTGEQIKSYFRV